MARGQETLIDSHIVVKEKSANYRIKAWRLTEKEKQKMKRKFVIVFNMWLFP